MNVTPELVAFAAFEEQRLDVRRASDRCQPANDRWVRHCAVCKASLPAGRPGMR
jgi:hypothetical protein